ncbi:LysR substrate-binding domain-containing protein [Ramlibacter sp.]|uniref:LysR substrate-binding domain-containing protein n=1 Tax=Ramlibacter sp. TaxID=1917967 RepID=UPI0035B23BC7
MARPIDRALRSNIKLRHLQLVVALDEFRHVGRTAEFLSVTQPAVSRMLGEVEAMLGQVLFERSTRGSTPTAAGAAFIRFAKSALAEYERTRDEMAAVESGHAGRTRVGCMVVALPTLLAPALDRLKARAPAATVLVEEGDLTHLLPKLRTGELDLFIGRLEPAYAAPDLETEALRQEPMVVVARPGHALAAKRRVRWVDLAAQPFVMPPPWASSRVKIVQCFYAAGLQPPTDIVESASFLAQVTFLHQRGACALMARSVARHFEGLGLVRVLRIAVQLDLPPVGMMWLRARPPTRATAVLMEDLRAVA